MQPPSRRACQRGLHRWMARLYTEAEVSATVSVSAPIARPRVGLIFSGLMLVVLLAALDQTIVATALPSSATSAAWTSSLG
jgi:hypothetical protein